MTDAARIRDFERRSGARRDEFEGVGADVHIRDYGDSAINIQDTQAYDQNFIQCRDIGFISSLHGVYGAGAFGATITNGAKANIVSTTATTVESDSLYVE